MSLPPPHTSTPTGSSTTPTHASTAATHSAHNSPAAVQRALPTQQHAAIADDSTNGYTPSIYSHIFGSFRHRSRSRSRHRSSNDAVSTHTDSLQPTYSSNNHASTAGSSERKSKKKRHLSSKGDNRLDDQAASNEALNSNPATRAPPLNRSYSEPHADTDTEAGFLSDTGGHSPYTSIDVRTSPTRRRRTVNKETATLLFDQPTENHPSTPRQHHHPVVTSHNLQNDSQHNDVGHHLQHTPARTQQQRPVLSPGGRSLNTQHQLDPHPHPHGHLDCSPPPPHRTPHAAHAKSSVDSMTLFKLFDSYIASAASVQEARQLWLHCCQLSGFDSVVNQSNIAPQPAQRETSTGVDQLRQQNITPGRTEAMEDMDGSQSTVSPRQLQLAPKPVDQPSPALNSTMQAGSAASARPAKAVDAFAAPTFTDSCAPAETEAAQTMDGTSKRALDMTAMYSNAADPHRAKATDARPTSNGNLNQLHAPKQTSATRSPSRTINGSTELPNSSQVSPQPATRKLPAERDERRNGDKQSHSRSRSPSPMPRVEMDKPIAAYIQSKRGRSNSIAEDKQRNGAKSKSPDHGAMAAPPQPPIIDTASDAEEAGEFDPVLQTWRGPPPDLKQAAAMERDAQAKADRPKSIENSREFASPIHKPLNGNTDVAIIQRQKTLNDAASPLKKQPSVADGFDPNLQTWRGPYPSGLALEQLMDYDEEYFDETDEHAHSHSEKTMLLFRGQLRKYWRAFRRDFSNPDNVSHRIWCSIIVLTVIYFCAVTPWVMAFYRHGDDDVGWLRTVDIVLDVLFILDIAKTLTTGYDRDSSTVFSFKRNLLRYASDGTLFFDLLSISYFGMIFYPASYFTRGWSLTRLGRLYKVPLYVRHIVAGNTYSPYYQVFRLAKYCISVIIACHAMACLWLLIAFMEVDAGLADPNRDPASICTWMSTVCGYGVDNLSDIEQYVAAFDFSITTMTSVGYGDITPKTTPERVFTIVWELAGAFWFAFIIGNLAYFFAYNDQSRLAFTSKLRALTSYLRYRGISDELQRRVINYFSYGYKQRQFFPFSGNDLLSDLSASLKREVLLHTNLPLLLQIPLLRDADPHFLRKLMVRMNPLIVTPHDLIVIEGDVARTAYFIVSGSVEVYSHETQQRYLTLTDGDFFGEYSLFVPSIRTASVRALTHADMFSLSSADVDEVSKLYPHEGQRLKERAIRMRQDMMQTASAEADSAHQLSVTTFQESNSTSDTNQHSLPTTTSSLEPTRSN